tara:strand:- start:2296 stop:2709 length:414 start_codon:yes stop_codon:yes gene_type:complete
MKKIVSIILLSSFLNVGCSSVKHNSEEVYIQLSKERCFGKCPVYDLFIYKDGTVAYNGIDNVAKKGQQNFKISEDELREIESLFLSLDFKSLKSKHKKRVRDLPKAKIKYGSNEVSFLVGYIPEEVKKIIATLESLI